MSIEQYQNYNSYIRYVERALAIWGQKVTVFQATNNKMLGYEDDLGHNPVNQEPSVTGTQNSFESEPVTAYIDYHPKRSVFYQFNYFPEKQEELVIGFFSIFKDIKELAYVRTAVIEQVSVWGDIIFKVDHTIDIGKFKVLKRMHFLRPVSDQSLDTILAPAPNTPSNLEIRLKEV